MFDEGDDQWLQIAGHCAGRNRTEGLRLYDHKRERSRIRVSENGCASDEPDQGGGSSPVTNLLHMRTPALAGERRCALPRRHGSGTISAGGETVFSIFTSPFFITRHSCLMRVELKVSFWLSRFNVTLVLHFGFFMISFRHGESD